MKSSYLPAPYDHNYALFLDVDGTLAEFCDNPADVWLSESMLLTLSSLRNVLQGAVALISGRGVEELNRMIDDCPLCCIGLHGLTNNEHCPITLGNPQVSHKLADLRRDCRSFTLDYPGVTLEDKQFGLALHYRRNPQLEAAVRSFAQEYQQRNTSGSGFELMEGKMLVEFRPPGANKGAAIQHLLTKPPFSARIPVFIGDDVTDEAGFSTVNDVGGISIKCGEGASCATYRLPDVAAVHRWLELYSIYLAEA